MFFRIGGMPALMTSFRLFLLRRRPRQQSFDHLPTHFATGEPQRANSDVAAKIIRLSSAAPKHGTHARHKFPGVERLREIIIGSQIEAPYAMSVVASPRQQ
jgi:hypothetical protein